MGKHQHDLLDSFQSHDEHNISNTESIFSDSIKGLFSTKKLSMKTELNKKQVGVLARAEIYATKYNSKVMKSLIKEIMLKNVSLERKGRDDVVNLIKGSISPNTEDSSLMDRLMGKK